MTFIIKAQNKELYIEKEPIELCIKREKAKPFANRKEAADFMIEHGISPNEFKIIKP